MYDITDIYIIKRLLSKFTNLTMFFFFSLCSVYYLQNDKDARQSNIAV